MSKMGLVTEQFNYGETFFPLNEKDDKSYQQNKEKDNDDKKNDSEN